MVGVKILDFLRTAHYFRVTINEGVFFNEKSAGIRVSGRHQVHQERLIRWKKNYVKASKAYLWFIIRTSDKIYLQQSPDINLIPVPAISRQRKSIYVREPPERYNIKAVAVPAICRQTKSQYSRDPCVVCFTLSALFSKMSLARLALVLSP